MVKKSTMKAILFDGEEVKIQDMPKPQPTATQALIRVKAGGICGTDLAIVQGHLPPPGPIILGHEFTGIVEAVGDKVDKKWIGKKVAVEINSNIDHDCFYCQRKMFTQCVQRKALGIDINGGFAEYAAIEAYLLHEIPEGISLNDATFIEPLAAAYQTFEMMPLDPDDKNMAIFGLGKLGLLILQVGKTLGLKIFVIDGSDKKLELAKLWGASMTFNRKITSNIPAEIKKLTAGLGADIVVDCTGNPDALKDIVASCRTRGKLHMKSTHGLATPINLTELVVREITIYTSRCGPFEKAIAGIKSGKIHVAELVSKVFPFTEIHKAIASYAESKDHIKTILEF